MRDRATAEPASGRSAMDHFSKEELEEALRAITSTISKCEKVQPKLKSGGSQHTLLMRRIKAFRVASALIMQVLEINEKSGSSDN